MIFNIPSPGSRELQSRFWSVGVSPASGFVDVSSAYFHHFYLPNKKFPATGGRDARDPSDFTILMLCRQSNLPLGGIFVECTENSLSHFPLPTSHFPLPTHHSPLFHDFRLSVGKRCSVEEVGGPCRLGPSDGVFAGVVCRVVSRFQ